MDPYIVDGNGASAPTAAELAAAAKDALAVAGSQDAIDSGVESLQKVAKERFSPKQGLDAADELTRYEENCKRADDAVRKSCGTDVGLYNQYLAASAQKRREEHDAVKRVVEAEIKSGLNVSAKEATERRIEALISLDNLRAAGALSNQAADGLAIGEAFQSGVNVVDSQHDFGKNQIESERDARLSEAKTEEDKQRILDESKAKTAALDSITVETRAALGGVAAKQLGEVSGKSERFARDYAPKLRDEFRNIFMQRYKAQLAMRQSPEIARAVAEDAVRGGAVRYFSERIKSGQVSSVLYTLDELEKIGDADYKSSISEEFPIGQYDPSAYGFLRKNDIFALRKAAVEQTNFYRHVQNLKTAGRDEGLKIANAKIRYEADRLARQPILDMDAIEQLFSKTEELINAGLTQGAETSTYLRGIVERAERRLSRTQKEASKLQTEEDFEREYNTFMRDINRAAPMYFFSQTADGKNLLQFTMDESGKPVHIDGQNRMIHLIRNGLSRGVVKGKVWNERLEQLENDRAMEDRYAAISALADAGISFDPKGTRNVIDARGGSFADMNDERGGVSASSWGEDKSTHRLRVGNPQMMMYTYRDPVTGRTVPINGTQLNDLLEEVGLWQMRHPNPSPTGEKPVELAEFIKRSLDRAIVRETKKHWFSKYEHDVPVGFGDIRHAAHMEYEAYFAPKGNVPVYGRDMWVLQGKVLGSELPTTDTIRKFLTDPKVWTTKGK